MLDSEQEHSSRRRDDARIASLDRHDQRRSKKHKKKKRKHDEALPAVSLPTGSEKRHKKQHPTNKEEATKVRLKDMPSAKDLIKYQSAMKIRPSETKPATLKKVKHEKKNKSAYNDTDEKKARENKKLEKLPRNFKFKEPSDMMRNEEKLREIEGWGTKSRKPLFGVTQEAVSLQLMPSREEQNQESLALVIPSRCSPIRAWTWWRR